MWKIPEVESKKAIKCYRKKERDFQLLNYYYLRIFLQDKSISYIKFTYKIYKYTKAVVLTCLGKNKYKDIKIKSNLLFDKNY